MDNFNVPKKVNRHVLKAITILTQGDSSCQVPVTKVIAQVKHQMRNLVPVRNIDTVVRRSLKNLSKVGVINRIARQRFTMPRRFTSSLSVPSPHTPPSSSTKRRQLNCPIKITRSQVPMIFPPNEKPPSDSRLNPNARNVCHSSESLSGDEFERTRKRFYINKKGFKFTGRRPVLPRYRVPSQQRGPKQRAIQQRGAQKHTSQLHGSQQRGPQRRVSQQRSRQQRASHKRPSQQCHSQIYPNPNEILVHKAYHQCCCCCRNNFTCNCNDMMIDYDCEFYNVTTETTESNSGQDFTLASLSPNSSLKITEIIDLDEEEDANNSNSVIIKVESIDNDTNSNCIRKNEKNEKSSNADNNDDLKKTNSDVEMADVKMEKENDETENANEDNSCTSHATVLSLSKSRNTLNPMAKPQQSVSSNAVPSTSHFYIN